MALSIVQQKQSDGDTSRNDFVLKTRKVVQLNTRRRDVMMSLIRDVPGCSQPLRPILKR